MTTSSYCFLFIYFFTLNNSIISVLIIWVSPYLVFVTNFRPTVSLVAVFVCSKYFSIVKASSLFHRDIDKSMHMSGFD